MVNVSRETFFYFADLPRIFIEIAILFFGSLIYVNQVNKIIVINEGLRIVILKTIESVKSRN